MGRDEQAVRTALRGFFVDEMLDESVDLQDDTELSSVGVDSFALMEVLLFVERTWGVSLAMDTLTPDNTRSLQTLTALVTRTLSPPA